MSEINFAIQMALLISAIGFIVGLKLLASPKTARIGNMIASAGMILAIIMTTIISNPREVFIELIITICLGSIIGIIAANKIQMTAMPQMVAIFNGLGGAASVLVALAELTRYIIYQNINPQLDLIITSWFSIIIGGITFSGSFFAFGKLQGFVSSRPLLYPGQRILTIILFISSIIAVIYLTNDSSNMTIFWLCTIIALILGWLLVIPIGGADMPVVISLLNSYSGLAAMAAGFVVNSKILIISGALVGASGVILTRIMCNAMNRSLTNVVFGAFGETIINTGQENLKPMKEFMPMDAAMLFKNSSHITFIPGYGLAVSQAQHAIKELSELLKNNDINISFGIHPVAGRMPGHMNVLLAEADIPYEDLKDINEINSNFKIIDVAVIIGANDVVNPSALTDKTSPLFGMPILYAHEAKAIIVLKRGKGRGFAGIENPLFTMDKTGVIFGDAKKSLTNIITEYKTL